MNGRNTMVKLPIASLSIYAPLTSFCAYVIPLWHSITPFQFVVHLHRFVWGPLGARPHRPIFSLTCPFTSTSTGGIDHDCQVTCLLKCNHPINTTLEESHHTVGKKLILQVNEEIRTTLELDLVFKSFPPQHGSNPAFPWPCSHTDLRDSSEKRITVFLEC